MVPHDFPAITGACSGPNIGLQELDRPPNCILKESLAFRSTTDGHSRTSFLNTSATNSTARSLQALLSLVRVAIKSTRSTADLTVQGLAHSLPFSLAILPTSPLDELANFLISRRYPHFNLRNIFGNLDNGGSGPRFLR